AQLTSTIQADFMSREMPAFLGVDTLQSRDAAWRAASPARGAIPLASSHPPSQGREVTVTGDLPAEDAASPTVQVVPSDTLLELAREGGAARRETRGRGWLVAFALVGVALGLGGAALALL